jgi:hypothetical protein
VATLVVTVASVAHWEKRTVDKSSHATSSAFPGADFLNPHVFANGLVGSVDMGTADRNPLASGQRTSDVVGSIVTNGTKDVPGDIDALVLWSDDKAAFVAFAIDGFLGMDGEPVVEGPRSVSLQ